MRIRLPLLSEEWVKLPFETRHLRDLQICRFPDASLKIASVDDFYVVKSRQLTQFTKASGNRQRCTTLQIESFLIILKKWYSQTKIIKNTHINDLFLFS
jgi:hypothetical protein